MERKNTQMQNFLFTFNIKAKKINAANMLLQNNYTKKKKKNNNLFLIIVILLVTFYTVSIN